MGDPTHDKVMRRRPETQSHSGSLHDEVMRKRPDMQGRSGHKGPSRLAPASTAPCILSPFLLLLLFTLLQILVLPAKSSPVPLSVNEDQLKTLTNKSPGCRYPMTGPGMKEMLHSNPSAGILACLINVCSHCKKMLMIILSILHTVR